MKHNRGYGAAPRRKTTVRWEGITLDEHMRKYGSLIFSRMVFTHSQSLASTIGAMHSVRICPEGRHGHQHNFHKGEADYF